MTKEQLVEEMYQLIMDIACRPKCVQPEMNPKGEKTCLLLLLFHGGQALPSQLAEESGVTSARIAAILRQLESKGYITRCPNPEDRRQIQVHLSPEGWEASEMERRKMLNNWEEVIDVLGLEDAESGLRFMKRLTEYYTEKYQSRLSEER